MGTSTPRTLLIQAPWHMHVNLGGSVRERGQPIEPKIRRHRPLLQLSFLLPEVWPPRIKHHVLGKLGFYCQVAITKYLGRLRIQKANTQAAGLWQDVMVSGMETVAGNVMNTGAFYRLEPCIGGKPASHHLLLWICPPTSTGSHHTARLDPNINRPREC